eukprot:2621427-Pyramimonas_sp.AAC.1
MDNDELEKLKGIRKEAQAIEVYLNASATQGLVDPGAGSDVVGLPSLNREAEALARRGLRCAVVPGEFKAPKRAHGIGGEAKVIYTILYPMRLGGAMGVVETTVLNDDVPH